MLVTGDFVQTGGMDVANHALADWLATSGHEVHLVAHRVLSRLARTPGVHVHLVSRPVGSNYLGAPLLSRVARRVIHGLAGRDVVSIINGGNCSVGWATWLHYMHVAHTPSSAGAVRRLLTAWKHGRFLAQERDAVRRAGLVIANSELTRRHAIELLGAPSAVTHTVYYGTAERFHPPSPGDREFARRAFDASPNAPIVAFVGAPGDRRKGFDRVLAAWKIVCRDDAWRGTLVVVGAGSERARWQGKAAALGLAESMRFHGFTNDIREVLWASDLMLAPSRYEAYGLAVHESVSCGVSR